MLHLIALTVLLALAGLAVGYVIGYATVMLRSGGD
jgi:hypothetical protein